MGNAEGIHRRDQMIAELKKELGGYIQGQKVDAERIERLQTDHNNACRTIKELLKKRDLADAKNEDACNTIADLLAQVESLQIANENICTGDDSLRERFQNLQEANKHLIIQNDGLSVNVREMANKKNRAESDLFEAHANILRLQKKIEKLKKKNKHLLRALSC